jgi:5S rRNA maturation endonuclease (ribonuclease M5)
MNTIGKHTPQLTTTVYKLVKELGFELNDSSYWNDECDSFTLTINGNTYKVFVSNPKREEMKDNVIILLDADGEGWKSDVLITPFMTEIFECLKSLRNTL